MNTQVKQVDMIISIKKVSLKGAVYGFSGTDAANMDDYYDPDGTLRNPQEIYNLWKGQRYF